MATEFELRISETPDDRWDEFIECCEGNVYHDAPWLTISTRKNGQALYFLWLDEDQKPAAIAAGKLRRSSIPLFGKWNAALDFATTPAMHPKHRQNQEYFLRTLRDAAHRLGCKRLSIESHMGQPYSIDGPSLGFVEYPRIEFRVSLLDEEDAIWSGFSSHHRRKIRKAGRANIIVDSVGTEKAVWSLRAMQKESQSRRQARGEHMHLGDDRPVVDVMRQIISQRLGHLFLATVDDEVLSGALILFNGKQAYYVFGGSNPRGFSLNAPALLFWEMFRYCKAAGGLEFNLGGVPAASEESESQSHGLYRFKAGFGGKTEYLADLSANLRPLVSLATAVTAKMIRRN